MDVRRFGALLLCLVFVAGGCASSTPATSAPATSAPATTPPATTLPATPPPTAVPTPTPAPAAATPGPLAADDWPVYHLDAARTGNSASFPAARFPLRVAWSRQLDGAVYGQPIVVGPKMFVATEGDSVYSMDAATGNSAWNVSLGKPVPLNTLPCGNIDPLGITGTPAYDPGTGSLFVVAEVSGPQHILFALDPADGHIRWSRNVDVAGDDPKTHQQRPALAVANGYVYIGFGGLAGDCGQYVGKIVGVPTSGSGETIVYRVPTTREGAVWSTGGPAIDSAGNLYVSVGNGESTSKYDGSDSVLQLGPDLKLKSFFAPPEWAKDNAADLDLGSLSPAILPNGLVFIAGKNGSAYVLRQSDLGGIGGQVSKTGLCAAFGSTALAGNDVFVPCTDGVTRVAVAADGHLSATWKTDTGSTGPPVLGGGAVWSVKTDSGTLFALDLATGKALGSVGLGPVPHFASPTLWKGLVLVGTSAGVVAVSAS